MSIIKNYDAVAGFAASPDFSVETRPAGHDDDTWLAIATYATDVANVNLKGSDFHRYQVAVASFDFSGSVEVRVRYAPGRVQSAAIRPRSAGISPVTYGEDTISFTLDRPRDTMVEINGDKWKALHLLTNAINDSAPTDDTDDIWYFGPGLNNGTAYDHVTDGTNLHVPSGKTVYIAGGAFVTCRLNFCDVTNAGVRGHGFIHSPQGCYIERELGGAIYVSNAANILVQGVTSLGSMGFSLAAGNCKGLRVDRYRSFSFAGNGDGVDIFCSSDVTIENCFLRNSDDTIALYSHRWHWYGDSINITIRNCVLLPDIAHAINMGTHGNPDKPETTSNVLIQNIDILDHEEHQVWYQGCIAINAADENTFEDISIEDVRVEKITYGQLFNLRTMQNPTWTTAPGRALRNIRFKNVSLDLQNSGVVNPSQITGYDKTRPVENVTFENISIGEQAISEKMQKPRWYSVYDMVPVYVNEHVAGIHFKES
ncbi:putative glycoside hydrolase family protein [Rosellinia necatrix]|uniref:Putative glycoside hydrolase family protein n=1 Tax=Rosellinia necatrix TaxID=77044 RepID=A0A1W2TJY5_ROSNE|nr:putative glycoside hydrolase family protein [Rosellinia necatrix]